MKSIYVFSVVKVMRQYHNSVQAVYSANNYICLISVIHKCNPYKNTIISQIRTKCLLMCQICNNFAAQ